MRPGAGRLFRGLERALAHRAVTTPPWSDLPRPTDAEGSVDKPPVGAEAAERVAAEAAEWVAAEMGRLRALSYADLLAHKDRALHCEMVSSSGEVLIRETQIFWDKRRTRTLRVTVDVSKALAADEDEQRRRRRGIRSGLLIESFIRAPDGSFVDE